MRKIAIAGVVLAVFAALLIYASPYRTLAGIKKAVDANDGQALEPYVDYPLLRENLKAQLRGGVDDYFEDKQKDNPFAALGSALAGGLADNLVDSYVTPEGITELLQGRSDLTPPEPPPSPSSSPPPVSSPPPPSGSGSAGPAAAPSTDDDKLLKDPRLSFRSLSEVEIVAKNQSEDDVRFVLTRSGLTWKLTNVILPLDELVD